MCLFLHHFVHFIFHSFRYSLRILNGLLWDECLIKDTMSSPVHVCLFRMVFVGNRDCLAFCWFDNGKIQNASTNRTTKLTNQPTVQQLKFERNKSFASPSLHNLFSYMICRCFRFHWQKTKFHMNKSRKLFEYSQ